jgi:enoyl-CoA hydratase
VHRENPDIESTLTSRHDGLPGDFVRGSLAAARILALAIAQRTAGIGGARVRYDNYKTILVERQGRVLRVTLNRPETLNGFDGEMHEEMSSIFYDIGMDEEADVVVLTGAGRAFSAGGDMAFLQHLIDEPTAMRKTTVEAKRIVLSILEARQPVIARINGAAVGLGATVALACDVTFAAEHAKIGDPHVKVGFVAGDGGSALWPSLVGYARAREFLYTGELIEATRAAEIGLINHAVPADELDDAVDAFVEQLTSGATIAIQGTKAAINQPLRAMASANLDCSLSLEGQSNLSADHQEGVAAFREGRQPKFVGR